MVNIIFNKRKNLFVSKVEYDRLKKLDNSALRSFLVSIGVLQVVDNDNYYYFCVKNKNKSYYDYNISFIDFEKKIVIEYDRVIK